MLSIWALRMFLGRFSPGPGEPRAIHGTMTDDGALIGGCTGMAFLRSSRFVMPATDTIRFPHLRGNVLKLHPALARVVVVAPLSWVLRPFSLRLETKTILSGFGPASLRKTWPACRSWSKATVP